MKKKKVRPVKKMPFHKKPRKDLVFDAVSVCLGCCLLTIVDLWGEKSKEEIEAFFDRFNENMTQYNKGTNRMKMQLLVNVCKQEFHGLNVREL